MTSSVRRTPGDPLRQARPAHPAPASDGNRVTGSRKIRAALGFAITLAFLLAASAALLQLMFDSAHPIAAPASIALVSFAFAMVTLSATVLALAPAPESMRTGPGQQ